MDTSKRKRVGRGKAPFTFARRAAPDALDPALTTAGDVALTASNADSAPSTTADVRDAAHHRIVSSAAIISLGSLLSSVLGMVRLETINALFYPLAQGAFVTALRPIQQLSDLLAGGSVSGALIPTFVDYSARERRDELRHVYSTVANLVALVMIVSLVGLALAAPYFIPFETQKFTPEDQQLTVQLVQIASLSLLGLGLYFVSSALLYALKEAVYPAFATGIYHVGIMVCGILVLLFALRQAGIPLSTALHHGAETSALHAARMMGARGLAVGAAIGAAAEFLLLVPALRKVLRVWRPVLDLRHPAVRQILRLYAPIAVGLVISVAAQNLDISLFGRTPGGAEANTASFANTQTLVQFPVGIVAMALSLAVLPALAAAASANDTARFKRTLGLGFRLGLLLMVPAMTGLLVLGTPIMALLFQHGTCFHACTDRNVLALQNNVYQLPFIALDQLLIAAFYARKNTIVPMLVGIASIIFYAAAAVPFAQSIGLPALSFANALQNTSHAVILFGLLSLAIGNLGLRDMASGLARIGLAALAMAGVSWLVLAALPRISSTLFSLDAISGQILTVVLAGGAGVVAYFGLALALRVAEVRMLGDIVRRKLGRAS